MSEKNLREQIKFAFLNVSDSKWNELRLKQEYNTQRIAYEKRPDETWLQTKIRLYPQLDTVESYKQSNLEMLDILDEMELVELETLVEELTETGIMPTQVTG